jgi:hypothetical protein
MADASEDWAIEHVEEQQYDIISLLNYDATDVEVWGPNVTDRTTVEQENGARLSRPGGRRANSGGSHASGLASDRVR